MLNKSIIQHCHILLQTLNRAVIQSCIWNHKIHLAASISRLRIKNSALQLSHLLPIHLQDEKVAIAAANPIVTGWINPFKMKYFQMFGRLS